MIKDRNIKSVKQLNFTAENGFNRKSWKELFANPIIMVDVPSGKVLYNRLREVWEHEMVVCKASSE